MTGNMKSFDGNRRVRADQMIYKNDFDEAEFIGNVVFVDSVRYAESDLIIYNQETGALRTEGRSTLKEEGVTLVADDIQRQGNSAVSRLTGNVYLRDSINGVTLMSDFAIQDDSTDFTKTWGDSTTLIIDSEGDSMFISADTLISRIDSLGYRVLNGYPNVRIYKSDIQAICDSVAYTESDSMFRLFYDPVIWADTSQFSAQFIDISFVDNGIEEIYLQQNAFILNSPDEIYFNQIKGREITAYFKDKELSRMFTKGNAQTVYYILDELGAYIGVNKLECSHFWTYFGNNEVERLKFYQEPGGVMHPMQKVSKQQMLLEDFNWRIEERPKNRFDIYDKGVITTLIIDNENELPKINDSEN
jgi:hypothetical protein